MFEFLSDALLYGSIGLIVGWNVLPQPEWVQVAYNKAVAWVKSKLSK